MVGRVLLEEALDAGHEIVALVRHPEKLGDQASKVSIIAGDYLDQNAQRETIKGTDAVLTTVGPPMRRGNNTIGYASAMQTLISAMESASVSRIVALGGAGLKLGNENLGLKRTFMRRMLIMMSGEGYLEKEREHNVLYNSPLDWTILRPPQIKEANGTFAMSPEQSPGMTVDTRQLAKCMLDALSDASMIKRAPFVATV